MDPFDFVDEVSPKRRFNLRMGGVNLIWNIGTLWFLAMAVLALIGFVFIFINPWIGLNPYPPPLHSPLQPPPDGGQPLAPPPTSPSTVLAPSATPEPLGPQPTPTNIVLASPTPTVVVTQDGFRFVLQPGSLVYMDASTFFPDLGCNTFRVAGQVFDINGATIVSQAVKLTGTLSGNPVNLPPDFTKINTAYGNGAYYDFELANRPVASVASLEIMLLSQDGTQISEAILFNTFDDCTKNLIMINFVEAAQ